MQGELHIGQCYPVQRRMKCENSVAEIGAGVVGNAQIPDMIVVEHRVRHDAQ